MGKNKGKNRGNDLSRSFGKGAGEKPPMSKYAQKLARRRTDALEEARAVQKPLSGTAAQFRSAAAISQEERTSTTAMVTAAYAGTGKQPARIGRIPFPPLDPALWDKPCFLVADKRQGEWQVTRYVGDLSPTGNFEGRKDMIKIGLASDFDIQRTVFNSMVYWAKSQNPAKMDDTPQKIFAAAQNIYGQRPDRRPSGPRRF